ncbi:hypothetical protein P175DRAFT_0501888 [Aspergillus ochraceoroseus IBT 24754]|uniref:RTA1 domain protein n=3 Tax=Aspergillus subgen. Nidulantes TaxID=2720870 RepID=A0A0F8WS63_9EURO|nr:uncharacterized protein P175DRAFT_0501888 [Aspergillus ochraceoroseus IBT 24754]KKK15330.1 hypothetical protein AOCH_005724 [Aspergillus ochraceoroseus]KKK20495.1 hypothetical protein ARAM_001095 [Aspergillus rambellii]PTU21252.1 hypothetical protein P175DRAFT_0501888 [Aspergillus ochraceoroseus IBT 24754]
MDGHALTPRGGLAPFDLYPYNPSKTLAWVFLVIFAIGGGIHLILMFPLRAWFFIPFVLGCVGEAFGYYGRSWSHNNIRLGSPYLLQLMLLLGSVPLLAATVYMTLGRIVRGLNAEKYTVMRSTWMTKIYVVIDIGSFVCQMMGSAMQGSGDPSGVKTGQTIVIAGLGVQLAALGWFIIESVNLHRRLSNQPTFTSKSHLISWSKPLWALHCVAGLVFCRSLYRLIEFLQGSEGSLSKHEAYMYVFDSALLSIAVFVFAAFHPGRLLRQIRRLGLNSLDDTDVMLD